jgi:hypothetical protein
VVYKPTFTSLVGPVHPHIDIDLDGSQGRAERGSCQPAACCIFENHLVMHMLRVACIQFSSVFQNRYTYIYIYSCFIVAKSRFTAVFNF